MLRHLANNRVDVSKKNLLQHVFLGMLAMLLSCNAEYKDSRHSKMSNVVAAANKDNANSEKSASQSTFQEDYLDVSPASSQALTGVSQNFFATVIHLNGDKEDVTTQATWSITGTAGIVTSLRNGVFKGIETGSTQIKATFKGLQQTAKINVNQAKLKSIRLETSPPLILDETRDITAIGEFEDQSTRDISADAIWETSDSSTVKLIGDAQTPGRVHATAVGSVTLSARLSDVVGKSSLQVVDVPVTSLEITAASASIAKGKTTQLQAIAHLRDGTTRNVSDSATWLSDTPTNASVGNSAANKGRVSGIAVGVAMISASFMEQTTQLSIVVTPATLSWIAVTPPTFNLNINSTKLFTANGTFSDGSTSDITSMVTWISSDPMIAAIDNSPVSASVGVLLALSVGTTSVTATLNGKISNPASVIVMNWNVAETRSPTPTATATSNFAATIVPTITPTPTSTTIAMQPR